MTEPLTDAELAAMQGRVDAATFGPWKLILHGNEQYPFPFSLHTADDAVWITRGGTVSSLASARFIAHARADVPRLLAEIAALREGLQRIKEKDTRWWIYGKGTRSPEYGPCAEIARALLPKETKP